jgi:hypothetical protein
MPTEKEIIDILQQNDKNAQKSETSSFDSYSVRASENGVVYVRLEKSQNKTAKI